MSGTWLAAKRPVWLFCARMYQEGPLRERDPWCGLAAVDWSDAACGVEREGRPEVVSGLLVALAVVPEIALEQVGRSDLRHMGRLAAAARAGDYP